MNKTYFKEGDLVQLKSGGPVMTVDTIYDGGDCRCVWFAGEKQQAHVFSAATLISAE